MGSTKQLGFNPTERQDHMSSNLTLDDIQNAFDIIDENGGLGSWEEGTQTSSAERWEFPRFPGADKLGKCSTKAHGVKGNHEEIKSCKGWAPDGATLYLSRSGLGPYDSDVETICAWLDAPPERGRRHPPSWRTGHRKDCLGAGSGDTRWLGVPGNHGYP